MKDELISLKTAKLAKQKGFDLNTIFYWNTDNPLGGIKEVKSRYFIEMTIKTLPMRKSPVIEGEPSEYESYMARPINSAPTQSLLQRWLREVHGIHFHIDYSKKLELYFVHFQNHTFKMNSAEITYEQALEAGLFEALKLIKDD